jgi:hypothetical protein
MVRTRCEKPRDNKGRFIVYNNNQRYKTKQVNGKRKGEHVLIWEKHNKKLPDGWIVHHINEDKKDNRIENLKAMSLLEHNRIHLNGHTPWNKGITTHHGNNELGHKVTEKQKARCRCSWFNKYLDSNLQIWKLKDDGYTPTKISKELNLTTDQVNNRWKAFTKIVNPCSGRLI